MAGPQNSPGDPPGGRREKRLLVCGTWGCQSHGHPKPEKFHLYLFQILHFVLDYKWNFFFRGTNCLNPVKIKIQWNVDHRDLWRMTGWVLCGYCSTTPYERKCLFQLFFLCRRFCTGPRAGVCAPAQAQSQSQCGFFVPCGDIELRHKVVAEFLRLRSCSW